MNVEAWHFLVSRNRHLDYRTVVAPDFICKANISNLLARVADGGLTESNHGFIRQITGSKVGDFTIVFRVINETEKYLNSEGRNETLKDSFGREIYIIEGIVVKGIRRKRDFHITNQYIEEAHNFLMEGYRQFWEYREPHPAIPSHKFSLNIDSSSNPLQLEELEAFQVSSKDRIPSKSKLNLVAFIVPIIVVLMVAIWLTTISYPFGKSMVDGCTTTEEIDIPFKNKDKVDSILNDQQKKWQKDYPKAEIFLNGSLKVESPDKLKFLREREELTNSTKYTIDLDTDNNSLQMQDHPLDLAIAQFHNHKVADKRTIKLTAKIINKKECIKSANPKQV
ncbi:hypothetical protein LC612_04555 [Nostoc sp. CHAB 5834]|nr:hypothetical protein [Nostoc sp. CHAB 5834]